MISRPLGYFERDSGYITVASSNGQTANPAWYYNIQPNPQDVTIEVLDKKMKINPEIILGERRKPVYGWIVSIAPNYGAYEKGSTREILLVLLKHNKK